MEREKIYFLPGDVVELKQDIPNKPKMIVKKKATKMIRPVKTEMEKTDEKFLLGIVCFWFTTDGLLQEAVFNTKDLKAV